MRARFRKLAYGSLALVVIACASGIVFGLYSLAVYFGSTETRISFLDVGQGDAILISSGISQILIDGGPDGRSLLEEVGSQMPLWDRTIEVLIVTHPDKDHIDGLIDLLGYYKVERLISSDLAEKESSISNALHEALQMHGVARHAPLAGEKIYLPSGAFLEILYPYLPALSKYYLHEPNNASVVTLLQTLDETFYMAGDLHSEIEDRLDLSSYDITVLKASHHGSGTSSSAGFLIKNTPRDVIFSVGSDNSYGHPKREVLNRYLNLGAQVYRTDLMGTITYRCKNECVVQYDAK